MDQRKLGGELLGLQKEVLGGGKVCVARPGQSEGIEAIGVRLGRQGGDNARLFIFRNHGQAQTPAKDCADSGDEAEKLLFAPRFRPLV